MLDEPTLLITGLPSPGKARLVDALQRRLRPSDIAIRVSADGVPPLAPTLHVHAETDLEALVEGRLPARDCSTDAELVVPVDWEPVERSVSRVVATLVARGIATAGVG